jgi:rfaE bifunctional protein nucleotidyltransferase chain/domain
VVVCDYGRGITAHHELKRALTDAARRRPLVWDPHPKGAVPVPGTALAVPNADEALVLSGTAEPRDLAGDTASAIRLLAEWPVKQVAITRGRAGTVLVAASDAHPLVVPARPTAGDTCGAGDQLAVTATVMLGAGRLPSHAVAAAVEAATAYVQAGGPAGLHAPRPAETPGPLQLAARVRERGGKVVGAGGCFDLLHAGHLSLLAQARRLGDVLVVCINSDDSVRRLKGDDRPVVGEGKRAALLEALDSVDSVLVFGEDTPERVLSELRPDVWVKGADYGGSGSPKPTWSRAGAARSSRPIFPGNSCAPPAALLSWRRWRNENGTDHPHSVLSRPRQPRRHHGQPVGRRGRRPGRQRHARGEAAPTEAGHAGAEQGLGGHPRPGQGFGNEYASCARCRRTRPPDGCSSVAHVLTAPALPRLTCSQPRVCSSRWTPARVRGRRAGSTC